MIYFFHGAEFFLRDRQAAALEKKLLEGCLVDFNRDRFSGKEVTAERIIESCKTLPMMAPHRVVGLTEAEQLKKRDQELLEAFLPHFPETTALIIVAGKVDRRQSFWRFLESKAKTEEFRPPYPRELPGWVMAEGRSQGLQLDPQVASLLPELVGHDLGELSHSLEKLALYAHPRQTLTLADVEAGVTDIAARSVFALAEAVGTGAWAQSLSLVQRVVGPTEPALKVLGLLLRQFRLLLRAKEAESTVMNQGEWAKLLGVAPYFVSGYREQARQWSRDRLIATMEILYRTDRMLKGSSLADRLVMENMIFNLAAQGRDTARKSGDPA